MHLGELSDACTSFLLCLGISSNLFMEKAKSALFFAEQYIVEPYELLLLLSRK